MRYCPDCGTPHECAAQVAADKSDVQIARINADRDVEIERLRARAATSIAETEAEHSAEHAEGVAEGMETVIEAASGEGDAEEPGEPIVVETPAEPEPEPEADMVPPEVVSVPEPKAGRGSGWWDHYR